MLSLPSFFKPSLLSPSSSKRSEFNMSTCERDFCDIRARLWGKSSLLTSVMWKPETALVAMWERTNLGEKGDVLCKTCEVLLTESLEVQVMEKNKSRFKVHGYRRSTSTLHNLTNNTTGRIRPSSIQTPMQPLVRFTFH